MSQFEFVVAILAVLVGLSITHMLSALGEAIHRLRGQGAPIRLDATFLLWAGVLLTWLITAWWAEYKFQSLGYTWNFGTYFLLISYYIALFLAVVILIPSRLAGVADTYEHFMRGRAWFFGALLLATVLDFFDTLVKGTDWAFRLEYLISQTGLFLLIGILGLVFRNREVQIILAASAFLSQIIYVWKSLSVLGSW